MTGKRKRGSEEAQTPQSSKVPIQHHKLPRLPKNARLQKHPLLHHPIPSKYSAGTTITSHAQHNGSTSKTRTVPDPQQKTIYVSHRTPFMSAVSRACKLLDLADRRALQSAIDIANQRPGKKGGSNRTNNGIGGVGKTAAAPAGRGSAVGQDTLGALDEAMRATLDRDGRGTGPSKEREEVRITGSGRAVEKVLRLGLWFKARDGYAVAIRTGSVATMDEVLVDDGEEEEEEEEDENRSATRVAAGMRAGDRSGEAERSAGTDTISGGLSEQGETSNDDPALQRDRETQQNTPVSGPRIRYVSIVEALVSRTT